jgi:hypothetical protein
MQELLKSTSELAVNQYGRKVLLYLLAPRDPLHFHPDIIAILHQGDGNLHRSEAENSAAAFLCKDGFCGYVPERPFGNGHCPAVS